MDFLSGVRSVKPLNYYYLSTNVKTIKKVSWGNFNTLILHAHNNILN